jgi:hypothetical protein
MGARRPKEAALADTAHQQPKTAEKLATPPLTAAHHHPTNTRHAQQTLYTYIHISMKISWWRVN